MCALMLAVALGLPGTVSVTELRAADQVRLGGCVDGGGVGWGGADAVGLRWGGGVRWGGMGWGGMGRAAARTSPQET